MQRDMDLIRKILVKIEQEYEPGDLSIEDLEIDGYDSLTVAEHCDLLNQQGLIKQYDLVSHIDGGFGFSIGNLTARGYDYLELIRNDEVWENIRSEIRTKKGPSTIDTISKAAGIFWGNFFDQMKG